MTFAGGRALERDKRYMIAFNSFDARSGGHHFMKLRALLDRPEANCVLHPVQTRDAVIDYFRRHKVVQKIAAITPLGITARVESRGPDCRITSMTFPDGRAVERDKKYMIAFNSFDARSGGHHFMKLRALLDRREANCVLHPVQTRDAVIEYFRRHKVVQKIGEARALEVAA